EQLIQYWLKHGRPAEIAAAPSGPIRITSRGIESALVWPDLKPGQEVIDLYPSRVERLAIDGPVWGRETAWLDPANNRVIALTTWAGALPFEAVRNLNDQLKDRFIAEAVADRI